ncbi:hypothetical protein CVT24_012892 [Panaeolus cyanescens]|uniref:BTB domain-containing protein n=1 Tax=Panaeolus cyanescens TaxID=181874 RepID=A0A409W2V9_9AGAR|nr:hypothetical protein CVT24_012892 [Panaeolus cyanescens]
MEVVQQEGLQKKRKLDDGTSGTPVSGDSEAAKVQRGRVWMDDGNIILQTGQTQFRVHRSILSRASPVFRDMFSMNSIPQPSETLTDGCPVVHLHDSPEDLFFLLTAIYNPSYTAEPIKKPPRVPLAALSALLRLGNKYEISLLRKNLLLRIQDKYVCSWDNVNFQFSMFHRSTVADAAYFDMANLLYEEGVISALPLALYDVIRLFKTADILAGVLRKDETRATLLPQLLTVCLTGKEKLENAICEMYKWLRETPITSTCRYAPCRGTFLDIERQIFRPATKMGYALEFDWDFIFSQTTGEVCGACAQLADQKHEDGREEVFATLPYIFGYTSWDEIKKMDRYPLQNL